MIKTQNLLPDDYRPEVREHPLCLTLFTLLLHSFRIFFSKLYGAQENAAFFNGFCAFARKLALWLRENRKLTIKLKSNGPKWSDHLHNRKRSHL